MRHLPRHSLPLLALCAVLSGCGQTGPLYLPDQVPESEKPPSQRNKERALGKPNAQQTAPAATETAPTDAEDSSAPATP